MSRSFCINAIKFGDLKFYMHSVLNPWGEDDPIVAQALSGEFDENETLALWTFLASKASAGEVMLDIGSYAGLFSFLAVKQNPSVRVGAFEASSVTFGRLVNNIILNSAETSICASHSAAWNEETMLKFPHAYGVYTMSPGESALGHNVDHVENVPAMRLDDLISSDRAPGAFGSLALGISGLRVFAAKIDVEGAEHIVLRGGSEILRKHRPFLICELLNDEAVSQMKELTAEFDYSLSQIGGERNYLLCPSEKQEEIDADYDNWKATHPANLELGGYRQNLFVTSE